MLVDWRIANLVSVALQQAFRAICVADGSSLLDFEVDDDDEAQRAVVMTVPWLQSEQFAQSHEALRCHACRHHQGREPCDIAMKTPSLLGVSISSTIESASEAVVSLDDPCQSAGIRENTNLAMLSVINILSSHVLAAFDQPLSFSSTSSGRIDQEAL